MHILLSLFTFLLIARPSYAVCPSKLCCENTKPCYRKNKLHYSNIGPDEGLKVNDIQKICKKFNLKYPLLKKDSPLNGVEVYAYVKNNIASGFTYTNGAVSRFESKWTGKNFCDDDALIRGAVLSALGIKSTCKDNFIADNEDEINFKIENLIGSKNKIQYRNITIGGIDFKYFRFALNKDFELPRHVFGGYFQNKNKQYVGTVLGINPHKLSKNLKDQALQPILQNFARDNLYAKNSSDLKSPKDVIGRTDHPKDIMEMLRRKTSRKNWWKPTNGWKKSIPIGHFRNRLSDEFSERTSSSFCSGNEREAKLTIDRFVGSKNKNNLKYFNIEIDGSNFKCFKFMVSKNLGHPKQFIGGYFQNNKKKYVGITAELESCSQMTNEDLRIFLKDFADHNPWK
jgi:hypothetical protein